MLNILKCISKKYSYSKNLKEFSEVVETINFDILYSGIHYHRVYFEFVTKVTRRMILVKQENCLPFRTTCVICVVFFKITGCPFSFGLLYFFDSTVCDYPFSIFKLILISMLLECRTVTDLPYHDSHLIVFDL
jgi:hypothetical protein